MVEDAAGPLAVAEFVEYCRTQAGLLSGRIEELTGEAEALLDDVDEEAAAIRAELDARTDGVAGTTGPQSAGTADRSDAIAEIEDREADLEAKQTRADALQARIGAYQDLAAAYTDLAATLQSEVDEGSEAMERVVDLEADRDAPAYFPERQTVLEAAVASADGSPE